MGSLRTHKLRLDTPDLVEELKSAIVAALDEDVSEAVRDLCVRILEQYNQIPWTTAFAHVFRDLGDSMRQEVIDSAHREVREGDAPGGAALLLIAIAEQSPETRERLPELVRQLDNPAAQYFLNGYLASLPVSLVGEPSEFYPATEFRRTRPHELEAVKRLLLEPQQRALLPLLENAHPWHRSQMLQAFFKIYDGNPDHHSALIQSVKWMLERKGAAASLAFDLLIDTDLRRQVLIRYGNYPLRRMEQLRRSRDRQLSGQADTVRTMIRNDNYVEHAGMAARGIIDESSGDRQVLSEVIRQLADLPEPSGPLQFPEPGPDWRPADYAHSVRRLAPSELPVCLDSIATALGIQILYHPFVSVGFDGCLLQIPNVILSAIVVNERHGQGRQRFTIAHEVGHFLMHHDIRSTGSVTEHPIQDWDAREREAYAFAAELLMPALELRRDAGRVDYRVVDLDRLANKYLVSLTALTFALVPHARCPVAAFLSEGGRIYGRSRSPDMDWVSNWDYIPQGSVTRKLIEDTQAHQLEDMVDAQVWIESDRDCLVRESVRRTHDATLLTLLEVIDEDDDCQDEQRYNR